jgi:hypothetical protein
MILISGRIAQLVRAPLLHRGGRRFESYSAHFNPKFPSAREKGLHCLKVYKMKRSELIIQILVIFIIVVGAIILLIKMGIFEKHEEESHIIIYRVEGTASLANITYTKPDGSVSEIIEVGLPWKSSPLRFDGGKKAILTATNPTQMGSIACMIYLDGEIYHTDSAKAPGDKVACGVLVP